MHGNASDFVTLLKSHLNTLRPDNQVIFVHNLALTGYFVDDPQFWNLLTPRDIVSSLSFFSEPYSSTYLDRLETTLPKLENPNESILVAAILYRYNRASGYVYLSKQLRQASNIDAACVFASSQDLSMRDDIISCILPVNSPDAVPKHVQSSPHTGQLFDLLGRWHDAKVAQLVWKVYQESSYSGKLAAIAANQGVSESVKLSRRNYFQSSASGSQKWFYGTAIIKLDGATKAKQIIDTLVERILSPDVSNDQKLAIIQIAGYLQLQELSPVLRKIITDALTKMNSSKALDDSRLNVAINASEALSQMENPSASDRDLVFKLLIDVDQLNANSAYTQRVANALIKLNGTKEMLTSVMGEEWYQQVLTTQHLKQLPQFVIIQQGL